MTKQSLKNCRNLAGIADHNGENAPALAARYGAVDRARVYPDMYTHFMNAASAGHQYRILDIGCGSGDDAYAFAEMGHYVTAVDPSDLLDIARQKHAHPRIDYIDDTLPALSKVTSKPVFDAAVMSAVIQYIHPRDRLSSIQRVASNLKQGGDLYISYPNPPSRDHQYDLPLAQLLAIVKLQNTKARLAGRAPLLLKKAPDSIADSGGRRGIDGRPIMFHNCAFVKSSTASFTA